MFQGIEQHELARRIGEVIVAAQDVRDAHDRVVDGVAEEERSGAVLAADDEIADVVRGESLRAVHQVDEFDRHGPRGTAKRSVGLDPRAARSARCAAVSARQVPA